jgi:rRNA small subunit pseudouridine methyltransferase Nep1
MHTIQNRLFEFNPEIRIAKNYNRFKGLMAKLLIDGQIKVDGTYLIAPIKKSLREKLEEFKQAKLMLFTEEGTPTSYQELYKQEGTTDYVGLIGGFQKAQFSHPILNLTSNHVSISESALNAWIVVSRAITYYEIIHNIF